MVAQCTRFSLGLLNNIHLSVECVEEAEELGVHEGQPWNFSSFSVNHFRAEEFCLSLLEIPLFSASKLPVQRFFEEFFWSWNHWPIPINVHLSLKSRLLCVSLRFHMLLEHWSHTLYNSFVWSFAQKFQCKCKELLVSCSCWQTPCRTLIELKVFIWSPPLTESKFAWALLACLIKSFTSNLLWKVKVVSALQ